MNSIRSADKYTHTYTNMHTYPPTHTRTHARAHTHACAHTHARTHTHTHTHTYTFMHNIFYSIHTNFQGTVVWKKFTVEYFHVKFVCGKIFSSLGVSNE